MWASAAVDEMLSALTSGSSWRRDRCLDGAAGAGAGWRPLHDHRHGAGSNHATSDRSRAGAAYPRACAEIEANRQLPGDLVMDIAKARLFRTALPEAEAAWAPTS
jgi:hypothetical protein